MKEPNHDPVYIHGQTSNIPPLAERIENRRAVLRSWLKNGIPAGKHSSLPSSLRQAREWHDPELGIWRIASPNNFTQSDPLYGSTVREIAALLEQIRRKYIRTGTVKKVRQQPTSTNVNELRELRDALQRAVSQWHAARDRELSEKNRADGAEARSQLLLAENEAKDREIAELRRRLATREGLKVV